MQDSLDCQCGSQCSQSQPRPLLRFCGGLGCGGRSQCGDYRPVCGPGHHALHAVLEGCAAPGGSQELAFPARARTNGTGSSDTFALLLPKILLLFTSQA